VSRARLNIFLDRKHAKRLDELATMKGYSKSAIIAAALTSFLSPDGGDAREAAIARRLDEFSRHFDKLERDQTILIETVGLFVRHYLSVSLPVPEAQQEAARAQGRARFDQFIQQLARHLQRGKSLVLEVHEEIFPDESRLFGHAEASSDEVAKQPS
jgi:predicted transcriptional regulator